jgi:hypothetical protein
MFTRIVAGRGDAQTAEAAPPLYRFSYFRRQSFGQLLVTFGCQMYGVRAGFGA